MRRQARISVGGALVWRSASALQVWLWLLIFIFQNEFRISRSIQPGYLDFDNLPETNFTCAGKVIGGYYADLETSCQMFHVCTVGQQDEPMDIKFLCLNGTVFDQETRVCERVDEVDCTKSEKFYSLNLELYGSTLAPPSSEQQKPQPTEQSPQQTKPNTEPHTDASADESPTTAFNKPQSPQTEVPDSTEDPIQQDIRKEDPKKFKPSTTPSIQVQEDELTEEYEEEIDGDYEDYFQTPLTTRVPITTTTVSTTTKRTTSTTTEKPTTTSRVPHPYLFSSPSPILSSLSPPAPSIITSVPSVTPTQMHPTLDPAILTPQDYIYPHRGPGSEAFSYQSIRPADGVYITHAPPQQYDHFQYESSRTAPRPAQQRPTPFVQRQPSPFRPTTLDPRDQLLRPGPTSLPSERHETSVKHRQQNYPASVLPAQRPLPFNPFYYDRKRSDDSSPENESSLSARSVAPPTVTSTERPPPKPKSPPRVIVTASASVSDSNGKRLNYTVGNVVSAVKPIVRINYDDYKESDLLFDPFFLDVPKLQKRRKTRSNKNKNVFIVPGTATVPTTLARSKPTKSLATSEAATESTTTKTTTSHSSVTSTTAAWNPDDYVDDNYEPHSYNAPIPPIAVLVPHDLHKYKKDGKPMKDLGGKKRVSNVKDGRVYSMPTPVLALASSSQSNTRVAVPLPPPAEAHGCVSSQSPDCRTRA